MDLPEAFESMKAYRDFGIQTKLQFMTLLICGAVLAVAMAALFTFQVLNFRSNFQRDAMTLALIIANNSTAAMQFGPGYEKDATEVISALEARRDVTSASLVLPDRDHTLFAHYGRLEDQKSLSQFPNHRDAYFAGGDLLVTQPVKWKGEWVGTLYLRLNYAQTYGELLNFYGQVIAAIGLVAIALGIFLSSRLGRTITGPVLELARTAKIIGEAKDYSVRATGGRRGDELGRLTDSFNEMLARIQSQDAALNLSQQKMEALIHSIEGIVWERTPKNGQFTFVSRQCEKILGYPASAWLENPHLWVDKLHPQDALKAVQTGYDLAVNGQPYAYEYRMIAADGRVVWIRESGVALIENGKAVAVRGIMQDSTRQRLDAEKLEKLNRQLVESSRQAGMADVATGVLHNVGNVLNSVSVSATLVGERLRRSKVVNLKKATKMMQEQNGHLVEFLTNDPKGKLLPEYLDTVVEQINGEQDELIAEMKSVGQNIEHIKEIVAMQQNYAKVSGAYELLSVTDLVEDALRINLTAFNRHEIELIREFAPNLPSISVDRHKVLQILINLLRNAKHALEERKDGRKVAVRVELNGRDRVKIVVQDNGIGIPAENLTKIFNHGFTTKKDGHGFGLHSGANAAKEMGAQLTVHSDGPGKGAEFTLDLPVTPSHATQENSRPIGTS